MKSYESGIITVTVAPKAEERFYAFLEEENLRVTRISEGMGIIRCVKGAEQNLVDELNQIPGVVAARMPARTLHQ